MTGNQLPEDDHVVRYVKPSLVEDETIDGGAFLLRTSETALSVNWMEAFDGNRQDRLSEVRRLCRLNLARNGRFALFNVGEAKRHVSGSMEGVGISAAPLDPTDGFEADPSHAEITGLPPGDSDDAMLIGDLLAQCVIYPLHAGKEG